MKKLLLGAALTLATMAQAQVTLNINTTQRGPEIGACHYGIFFEEINHAGDGGLYAELIRNRSFEDNDQVPDYWSTRFEGYTSIVKDNLLTSAQRNALGLKIIGRAALLNSGFWGINVVKGRKYDLSFWIKGTNVLTSPITASLNNADGKSLGKVEIDLNTPTADGSALGGDSSWKQYTATITADGDDAKGTFSLEFFGDGDVVIDMVSLFPPTYKDRKNGCRIDLAEKLAAMHPAFMRFPGGCYVEGEWRENLPHYNADGTWSWGSTNRFEWKQTIGALEQRPGHWNVNWNYRVSDGLGFHEMLQLAEDLGAEPLFVVNMGMGHGWMHDYRYIDEYIQEALDAIEYCNGDASTKYGAMRIANGHEAPFNLRLIEIGNENYNFTSSDNRDQSDHYAERYRKFYDAIKKANPEIVCIGDVEAWGTDNPSWRNPHPVDAVDEHYYRNPGWFVNQYNKYDSYDRKKSPKVYAGEYAVTSDCSAIGDLKSALGEAVYMQGMENNSDICVMSSYAPIFVNENDQKWLPDMIRFNSAESYGTPSYYVQQLMPTYVGKQNVKWTESGNTFNEDLKPKAGLSTWLTSATFTNMKINGQSIPFASGWTAPDYGSWSASGSTLTQSSTSMEGALYVYDADLGNDYTIEVDATKTGGAEGFLIAFNYKDENNYCWLNLGGWGNSKHAVEVCTGGAKSTVASTGGYLATGQTYHIRIDVKNGNTADCYLDGKLLFTANISSGPVQRKVYVSTSINDEEGKMYLKLVNPNGYGYSTRINLADCAVSGGKLIQMKHENPNAVNSSANMYAVVPSENAVYVSGSSFDVNVPAYSFNILVLDIADKDAQKDVEDGVYYIYNKEAEAFLSRGADWGTRSTIDRYGVPVEVTRMDDGTYTLRYVDDMYGRYLGLDKEPYVDKNSSFPIYWNLQQVNHGPYVLQNTGNSSYLMAQGVNNGCTFTASAGDGTQFYFITATEYDALMKARKDAKPDYSQRKEIDHTDLIDNPAMATGVNGWENTFSRVASNYNLTEAYENYGHVQQTITGLTPGTYRFTLDGFYRGATNEICSAYDYAGYTIGNAYIYANDTQECFATWASERVSDANPNSMAQAREAIDNGKYHNEVVAEVGSDGVLTIGLCLPHYVPYSWLIWGNATLTELVTPVDETRRIVNPSFENGFTGWTNNGMQTQSNSEPSAGKSGTWYCERWTPKPGHLPDTYVKQTVTGLMNGEYTLTAYCHAENQSGNPALASGAYLMAGDNRASVNKPGIYSVNAIVIDGTLEIGFGCENTDANWITVDNFQLTWIGENFAGIKSAIRNSINKLQTLLDSKPWLDEELKRNAVEAIEDAQKAIDGSAGNEELLVLAELLAQTYDECKAYRIPVERNDPYVRYLFGYFPDNYNENLYYAVSENGFDYTPLNNGQRVMASDSVAIKKGIRDPHILRGVDGKTFYMVATDMRCVEGWDSNRGIVMYRSTDLVHWEHHTVHFPTRFPDRWKRVTRVWAPATIWDPEYVNADGTKGRYMVYFSLLTNDGTLAYDKVFYSYANDDFSDLMTEPVFLFDRGSATIDADIIYDETDRLYHMIYKNEGSGGICSVTATRLTAAEGEEPGSQWSRPSGTLQQTNVAVEGGGLFRLINTNTWVLMYDCYTSGYYQFCTTTDWEKFTLEAQTGMYGAFTPRHGSVLPVTREEYSRLLEAFPSNELIGDGICDVEAARKHSVKWFTIDGREVPSQPQGMSIKREVSEDGNVTVKKELR